MALSIEDRFLIESCKAARGYTDKIINIRDIANKIDYFKEDDQLEAEVTCPLISKKRINLNIETREMTVTRMGFYYAIKVSGQVPTRFGMVSYHEAKRISFDILKQLCEKSPPESNLTVNLKQLTINGYGEAVPNQIVDILCENGYVELTNKEGEARVTNQGRIAMIKEKLIRRSNS